MTYGPEQQGGPPYPQWPDPRQSYYAPSPAVLPYGTPLAPPKPASVTVLSIIGIVLASFWILGALLGVAQLIFAAAIMRRGLGANLAGIEGVLWMQAILAMVAGLIGIALLIMAIGCLRLARWGRRGIIAVAVTDLVFIVAKAVIMIAWAIPYQQRAFAAMGNRSVTVLGSMAGMQLAMAIGQAIFMSIFPVMVLIFMTRAPVKRAFEQQPY